MIRELLETPGEESLTPAYLRLDPLWDPIRSHPNFKSLAESPAPKTIYK
jgi:hypothetical protein